jgi:hypothetical protein
MKAILIEDSRLQGIDRGATAQTSWPSCWIAPGYSQNRTGPDEHMMKKQCFGKAECVLLSR